MSHKCRMAPSRAWRARYNLRIGKQWLRDISCRIVCVERGKIREKGRLEKINSDIFCKKNDGMDRHSITVQQMKNQFQAMIRNGIYLVLRYQDLRHVSSNERHLGAPGIRPENVDCCFSVSRSIQLRLLRFGRGDVPGPSSRWAPSFAT